MACLRTRDKSETPVPSESIQEPILPPSRAQKHSTHKKEQINVNTVMEVIQHQHSPLATATITNNNNNNQEGQQTASKIR